MRVLNSSSFSGRSVPSSPVTRSGRNCHWLRYSAVSLTKAAISSREIPLTTREPTNGGVNTSLSTATVGDRRGTSTTAASADAVRSGSCRPVGTRPKSGSHSPLRFIVISESSVDSPSNASRP